MIIVILGYILVFTPIIFMLVWMTKTFGFKAAGLPMLIGALIGTSVAIGMRILLR